MITISTQLKYNNSTVRLRVYFTTSIDFSQRLKDEIVELSAASTV
jgi:hypothetical protein